MDSGSKFLTITAVIVLAVMLQVFLIITENRQTPATVAVAFAKAYYHRDASLSEYLCADLLADKDPGVVTRYLNQVADEAAARGFDPSWMQMSLGHVRTETRMTGENSAEVSLSASMRRSINPLFAVVARIFFLGETYHTETTLSLVKEKNEWKVCGEPMALPTT